MRVHVAFLALAACVALASAPALRGGWVYDDRLMVGHPMLDGIEDVVPAFGRTSDDYFAVTRTGPGIAGGRTYRPLPMVSFILVNALVGPRPLAHHLVSLLCHLGVLYLLLRFAARGTGRVAWRALFVVTIFALHPANLETYGWINARSDALAGLALAGVLLVRRGPALFLVLLLGGLSKETFFVAAAAVLLASGRPRALAALVLAGAAVIALRFVAGGGLATSAGSVAVATLVARLPRIVGLAVETWIAPWPHAMRLLAWETAQPFPVAQALAAAVPLLAAVLFLVRREPRRAALVVGAVAALAPVVLVCDSFWLGFDRYLYLPAILGAAAALPLTGGGRAWAAGTALVALGLGAATFEAARGYRSHGDFAAAILADRPDEPTGYLVAADDAVDHGRLAEAGRLVDSVPTWDLPAPVAHHAAGLLLRLGRGPEAAALVERSAQAAPGDANLRFDLLTVRAAQHRWPDVIELARGLAGDPARRRAIAELVRGWAGAGQIPPPVAAELQALVGP